MFDVPARVFRRIGSSSTTYAGNSMIVNRETAPHETRENLPFRRRFGKDGRRPVWTTPPTWLFVRPENKRGKHRGTDLLILDSIFVFIAVVFVMRLRCGEVPGYIVFASFGFAGPCFRPNTLVWKEIGEISPRFMKLFVTPTFDSSVGHG